MKRLILLLVLLPWSASAAPVFPPIIAGTYTQCIQTLPLTLDADGVTLDTPVKSVGLLEDKTAALLVCEAMGDDQTLCVSYTLGDDGTGRVAANGYAYSNDDCTGLQSEASDNRAFHFFKGPKKVNLLMQAP